MDRRSFIKKSAVVSVGASSVSLNSNTLNAAMPEKLKAPLFVSTWNFGKPVNEQALKTLNSGASMLDAIEKGIWVAEADEKNASVGLGGIPNANGVVQLDACIMTGPDHGAGSVAGIESILHPISVARKVMEETIHVMLVGEGAKQFAIEHGFKPTQLLTPSQREKWEKRRRKQIDEQKKQNPKDEQVSIKENHDTIALLGLAKNGDIYGGCSTSGYGYKVPGRVGDSPILGSGLYVDNEVGAAGATGIGENVMRYCASFMIVHEMRNGADPETACKNVINYIAKKDPRDISKLEINFVALDKSGRFGAAGTSKGFEYSVTNPKQSKVIKVPQMT